VGQVKPSTDCCTGYAPGFSCISAAGQIDNLKGIRLLGRRDALNWLAVDDRETRPQRLMAAN
jgi:hypothetical protein